MKSVIRQYREVLDVLPPEAKRFLNFYSVLLALLAVLDAAALGLLALVITPLSTGADVVLPVFGKVAGGALLLTISLICILVIAKGVASVLLLWWATRRLARYELLVGDRLFRAYMAAPWTERLKKNSAEIVRFTDGSVTAVIASFILPGATLLGEMMSLVAVIAVLAFAQPLIALVTLCYLGLIGAVLYFWITKHARTAGRVNLHYSLKTSRLITEMVGAMKEVTLRNKSGEVAEVVNNSRRHATAARANVQFLGQVPRFVLESGIIGGFLIVGGVGFLTGGPPAAMTAVALFSLAGFRMAPSVVRFQTVISQMTSTMPHAKVVVSEIRESEAAAQRVQRSDDGVFPENPGTLEVDRVSFRYNDGSPLALSHVKLNIPMGSTVAFVGASGSGKSTMIDLLLGLIAPSEGSLRLDGQDLHDVTREWRSRVGYVPQEVSIFDGTIAQNVALSWEDDPDTERVEAALAKAQLLDTIRNRPGGINGGVGERGLALSGGQRQRLGIARALYSEPLVLVMDEATSALDADTEAAVTEAVGVLRGETTVILVAHRLSTIMNADQIFYLDRGSLIASGSFTDLVNAVPDFARQAQLSGLA